MHFQTFCDDISRDMSEGTSQAPFQLRKIWELTYGKKFVYFYLWWIDFWRKFFDWQDPTSVPRENGSAEEPFSTLLFIKGTEQKKLSLEDFRNDLIRQEETIIFALIERAQFKQNLITYKPGNTFSSTICLFISDFFNYLICDLF